MRMSLKKDLHQLIKQAEAVGFRVTHTANGHYRWDSPLPECGPTFSPSTPSDKRALLNLRAHLRRVGLPRE